MIKFNPSKRDFKTFFCCCLNGFGSNTTIANTLSFSLSHTVIIEIMIIISSLKYLLFNKIRTIIDMMIKNECYLII